MPGNRIAYGVLNLTQLKILQEVITLVVFTIFAYFVFDQVPKWNHAISYLLIVGAVYFAFKAWTQKDPGGSGSGFGANRPAREMHSATCSRLP